RNIAGMLPMAIKERRTSSVAMRVSSRAVAEEQAAVVGPVVRVGLAALEELAAQAVAEVPAELVSQVARVEPVGREALAELVVPAAERELNRVEAQELVPAAGPVPSQVAELEHGPVAAPNHQRARPAVRRRTKSATAAHHPGLVQVPAEEDLVAVA